MTEPNVKPQLRHGALSGVQWGAAALLFCGILATVGRDLFSAIHRGWIDPSDLVMGRLVVAVLWGAGAILLALRPLGSVAMRTKRLVASAVALFLLSGAGWYGFRGLNMWLDNGPVSVHRSHILDIRRPGLRPTPFNDESDVLLSGWPGAPQVRLDAVGPRAKSLAVAMEVDVTTHPGAFAREWVSRIDPAALP